MQTAEIVEAVNADLPEGRRPIRSLAHPGDLSPKVLSVLTEKVPPEEIADKIRALLDMKRPTKHGEVPDARAMEAGIKLWLAYCVGLPVQRQEIHQTITSKTEDDNMRVLQSPAVLKAMEDMIAKAKEKAASETAK